MRAEQLHIAHAVEAANRIFDIGGNIVRNIVLGGGRVIRDKAGDQQEAATGFLDANPLLLYFLGQQRRGQLQFVLHLYLGNIGIGTRFKGERNGYRTGRVAGRRHIHQIVDAVHILLDNLSDRILYGLGICTGVGGGDRYRRRGDCRVLSYRQLQDGQAAGNHHNDSQHPGEDRSMNKKLRHGWVSLLHGRRRTLRFRFDSDAWTDFL